MAQSNIGQRLKEFRIKYQITMPEIARATGIAKENLYKWERGAKPSDILQYNKLTDYLDKMEITAGDGSSGETVMHYKDQFRRVTIMRVSLSDNRKPVPYFGGNMASGTVTLVNEKPELIVERADIPFIGEIDGLVEITGSSMEPTFKNGTRIAISRLNSHALLLWGEYYYVIDKSWRGVLRRVYPDQQAEHIQLVSDNPDQIKYPPFERSWNDIEAICNIKAGIIRY